MGEQLLHTERSEEALLRHVFKLKKCMKQPCEEQRRVFHVKRVTFVKAVVLQSQPSHVLPHEQQRHACAIAFCQRGLWHLLETIENVVFSSCFPKRVDLPSFSRSE